MAVAIPILPDVEIRILSALLVLITKSCPSVVPKKFVLEFVDALPVKDHALLELDDPVGPIGPVGPLLPAAPVAPVAPFCPFAPAAPVGPVKPVAPFCPFAPFAPLGPVAPLLPAGPVAPVGPGVFDFSAYKA